MKVLSTKNGILIASKKCVKKKLKNYWREKNDLNVKN